MHQVHKADNSAITILFPCLNEESTIGSSVDMAMSALIGSGLKGQVLVVDNGSVDASVQIARSRGAEVLITNDKGYGAALRFGIEHARHNYLVLLDADLTYDLESLPAVIAELQCGADLVIGNRFSGGIDPGAMPALNRYIGNPLLSSLARRLYGVRIRDFHCGLRGLKVEKIRKLRLKSVGMEFASEMIVIAAMHSLVIREVPVKLHKCPVPRVPHLRRLRDGWRHLTLLLSAAPMRLFWAVSLIFGLPGFVVSFLAGFGPTVIGNRVSLDVGSLTVGAMCVLVACQIAYLGEINTIFQRITYGSRRPIETRGRARALSVGGLVFLVVGAIGVLLRLGAWFQESLGPLEIDSNIRWLIISSSSLLLGLVVLANEHLLRIIGFIADYRDYGDEI